MNRRSIISAIAAIPVLGQFIPKAKAAPAGVAYDRQQLLPIEQPPYAYIPQPQAVGFHECNPWSNCLDRIYGDRASGKTWAAAGRVAMFAVNRPWADIAVVGRTEDHARGLAPLLKMIIGDHRIESSSEHRICLKNGATLHFVGQTHEGHGRRFSMMWFDECEITEQLWNSVRYCCEHFIATNDEKDATPTPGNTRIWHFERDRLRPWLATQPVPPGLNFSESYRRIVDGDIDRCEAR